MNPNDLNCLKADEFNSTSTGMLDGVRVIIKETRDPEAASLLENEYRLLLRISESGQPQASLFPKAIRLDQGNTCVLIRSYIPGASLETLVEGRKDRPGLPRERAVCYTLQILELLRFLHGLQPPVIQRDIKPQNIIVDANGRCHIIDMGISRELEEAAGRDTHVFGTPLTAPPEQFGYRQTDQRSDIYSAGVLLHYMLTGEYALDQPDPDPDLARVIRKAAAFDPDSRFQTADEMIRALQKLEKKPRRKLFSALPAVLAVATAACFLFGWISSASQVCRFREPLIEQAVRLQLGKPNGELSPGDLLAVESIHIFGRQIYQDDGQFWFLGSLPFSRSGSLDEGLWSENGGIVSLSDIALLPNLRELCLYRQQISDLSPLRETRLTGLGIGYNPVTDLSPLQGNTSITYLNLAALSVDPTDTVSSMPNLQRLNLSGTPVSSLRGLESLLLTELNLFGADQGKLDDASFWLSVSHMASLRKLTLNKLSQSVLDALAVSSVTELEATHANGIPFGALQRLAGLESLYFYADQTENLGGEVFVFPELTWLDIKNVDMDSLRCLSGMKQLKELFIYASVCKDYSGLDALPDLTDIYCTAEQKAALEALYPDAGWQCH